MSQSSICCSLNCSALRVPSQVGLIVLLIMLLAACGFHLRGSTGSAVALPPLAVQASEVSLRVLMEQWLHQTGNVPVVETEAVWFLRLFPERRLRRVLSVDSAGQVQEYELHYQLRFEVRDTEGRSVLAVQTVSVIRQYAYQSSAVLAMADEEAALWRTMQQEAVRRIGFKLQKLPVQLQIEVQDELQSEPQNLEPPS